MKNIAIVGSKPDTWEQCKKLDRRSWAVWRFSRRNYELPPKADLWFELHHPRNYARYEAQKPGYKDFINTAMVWEDFPFAELIDEFGPYFFHYGQAPWLIAYAITKKPKEIMLFGMEPGTEYGEQKKEIQHFMCVAEERGIKISAPEDPALNTYAPLYAVEQDWVGQKETLDRLRAKGIEPTKHMPETQRTFTSDQPRNKLVEAERAKQEARRLKYG
jgi:hypothetical protein